MRIPTPTRNQNNSSARRPRSGAATRQLTGRPLGRPVPEARRVPAHRSGAANRTLRAQTQSKNNGIAFVPAASVAIDSALHSNLALPAFSPAVPLALDWSEGQNGTSNIATLMLALLEEGVLRDEPKLSDWQGNLADTLKGGVRRWLDFEGGALGVNLADMFCAFTDNMSEIGFYAKGWCEAMGLPSENTTVGCFVLAASWEPYDLNEWTVGATLSKIEALWPGAGYAILGLIDLVALLTCPLATPRWAWGAAQAYGSFHMTKDEWKARREDMGYCDEEDEVDIDDESGLVTEESFLRMIPYEAIKCIEDDGIRAEAVWSQRHRRLVQRAASQAINGEDALLPAILAQALELDDLLSEARKLKAPQLEVTLNHLLTHYNHADWPLGMVRWNRHDPLPRMWDDHIEFVQVGGGLNHIEDEAGDGCPVVYVRGFDLTVDKAHPGSLPMALQSVRYTLRLLGLMENLLNLLDSNEDPPPHKFKMPPRPRKKKPKNLAEALGVNGNDGKEFVSQL